MEKKPKYSFSLTIEAEETESGVREVIVDLMRAEHNELLDEHIEFVEFDFQIRDEDQYSIEELKEIYCELNKYEEDNYDFLSDFAPMQRY